MINSNKPIIKSAIVAQTPKGDEKLFEGVWALIKNSFVLGKIQINRQWGDGFRWSDCLGNDEVFIKLSSLQKTSFLFESQAKSYIESQKLDLSFIDSPSPLVLFLPRPFVLVFSQISKEANFKKYLLKSLEPKGYSYTEEPHLNDEEKSFGVIFDIIEKTDEQEGEKEYEVIFINETGSHNETFIYNRSAKNLYKSLEVTLRSLKFSLDSSNFQIFKAFLYDVTRFENQERIETLEISKRIKNLVPGSLDLHRKEISIYREGYLKINPKKIESGLSGLLDNVGDIRRFDELGALFSVLYLQKLQISIDLCRISNQISGSLRKRSLDSHKGRSPSERRRKLSVSPSRISNAPKLDEKKSFFRNACACLIS